MTLNRFVQAMSLWRSAQILYIAKLHQPYRLNALLERSDKQPDLFKDSIETIYTRAAISLSETRHTQVSKNTAKATTSVASAHRRHICSLTRQMVVKEMQQLKESKHSDQDSQDSPQEEVKALIEIIRIVAAGITSYNRGSRYSQCKQKQTLSPLDRVIGITASQEKKLTRMWTCDKMPSTVRIDTIAVYLGLFQSQVSNWFGNRRMRGLGCSIIPCVDADTKRVMRSGESSPIWIMCCESIIQSVLKGEDDGSIEVLQVTLDAMFGTRLDQLMQRIVDKLKQQLGAHLASTL